MQRQASCSLKEICMKSLATRTGPDGGQYMTAVMCRRTTISATTTGTATRSTRSSCWMKSSPNGAARPRVERRRNVSKFLYPLLRRDLRSLPDTSARARPFLPPPTLTPSTTRGRLSQTWAPGQRAAPRVPAPGWRARRDTTWTGRGPQCPAPAAGGRGG